MTVVTSKSRPGSIVAEAFRLKAIAERAEKKPKEEPTAPPAKKAATAKKAAKKRKVK